VTLKQKYVMMRSLKLLLPNGSKGDDLMVDRTRQQSSVISEAKPEDELPVPWQKIQGGIWLLGLALLIWTGWIFPGIFILMAVSGLFQAVVMFYLKNQEEQKVKTDQLEHLAAERATWLPSACPSCGGPMNVQNVNWIGTASATCPYCNANIRPKD
jgi:hypothetical protein